MYDEINCKITILITQKFYATGPFQLEFHKEQYCVLKYYKYFFYLQFSGTLKGNGAGFTRLVERLIRGAWTPTAMETMQPSL